MYSALESNGAINGKPLRWALIFVLISFLLPPGNGHAKPYANGHSEPKHTRGNVSILGLGKTNPQHEASQSEYINFIIRSMNIEGEVIRLVPPLRLTRLND